NIDANNFLSHKRIDVVAKIIYCEYFLNITPTKFNRLFYYIHLKKWNKFKANDSFKKKFFDYENEFKKTILSIKKSGFDEEQSIIPIDSHNNIIDGSHRLATSIVLEKKIKISKFLVNSPSITIDRFINGFGLKNANLIDYLISNFIKYNKNLRIFTLFPVRDKQFDETSLAIIKKYGEIIIRKSFRIGNLINGFNICRTLYNGAQWIGNVDNKYKGAMWKAKNCFNNTNGIIDVILFSPSKEEHGTAKQLKQIKEEIRSLYNIHFHSIHSSDNQLETINYSKIFFHPNTQYFSQKRKGHFFDNFEKALENLNVMKRDYSQFVFSGSTVMAALGLRSPKDLDAFHTKDFILPNSISSHNSQIKYLNIKINEIIFDPRNYFFYMGFKFLSPKLLLKLKRKRNMDRINLKDSEDIEILNKFLK
ncbi:hypothetical protein OAJ70_02315, partial [Pelagibacteraceae bacterium]|nr:hypothetical protein [Pelagibacteraceae bacterium]